METGTNNVVHQSLESAEVVKIEKNSRGYNAEVRAASVERALEMLTLGAYYKYSSTAFVTFNSRITESIAQQMLLSHDAMEISHAPNPHDIIWENVSIPKSQVRAEGERRVG